MHPLTPWNSCYNCDVLTVAALLVDAASMCRDGTVGLSGSLHEEIASGVRHNIQFCLLPYLCYLMFDRTLRCDSR